MTFNFKEDDDIFYFIELILDSGLTRIKQYKKLEAEFQNYKTQPTMTIEMAKLLMEKEGYIFYKKPPNFGKNGHKGRPQQQKEKRHRRTKKEIEVAKEMK